MPSKKTGLFISAVNEPIVNAVMEKHGYTKISNAINFIIQEYDRLSKEDKKEVVEIKPEEKIQTNLNDWFVADNK
jgi:RNA:NAD 2'-phosphotransferase (TPT1/KptA family)